jgi:hypothetical protein
MDAVGFPDAVGNGLQLLAALAGDHFVRCRMGRPVS